MDNTVSLKPLGAFSIKDAKREFTKINRTVAERDGAVIVTNRGNPSTMIVSMKLLKGLLGEEAFKELLFDIYYLTQAENRLEDFLSGKEKTISLDELKKKIGR